MTDLLDQFRGRTFTIGGKQYQAPMLGWNDGLRIKAATEQTEAAIEDGQTPQELISDEDYLRMMLGSALDEMRADNVPAPVITWAAMISHAHNTKGAAVADELEKRGPAPELLAAQMAALRGSSTTSPATDAAGSSTKPPANTSGTKTPRRASPANRSAGQRSSKRGR